METMGILFVLHLPDISCSIAQQLYSRLRVGLLPAALQGRRIDQKRVENATNTNMQTRSSFGNLGGMVLVELNKKSCDVEYIDFACQQMKKCVMRGLL